MDKKILEFYNKRHLEPHKLIEKGASRGLSRHRIEAAMEHCYHKIMREGKQIPDIQIAWYVFNVAKDADATIYEQDNDLLEKAKQDIHKDENLTKFLLLFIIIEHLGYLAMRLLYG